MKRLSFILSFIVCICVANTNDVFSQKRELQQFKGKVTNLQGEPVRAVSIYIPGTGRYTSSDMNGDFSVEAKHKETLRFSHIGMKDVLIQLDKDFPSELLVRMKPDTFQINNIFIQKKQIIKVKPEDMPEQTMINFIINGPDFPGGLSGFDEFIKKNIQYPEEAFQAGEEGQVTVEFTIDVNGYVSDAKVTKSVCASLDKEALRIIESMPRWKSGMQLGRPVAVRMSVPINFVIEQDYQVIDSLQVKTNT